MDVAPICCEHIRRCDGDSVQVDALVYPPRKSLPWHLELFWAVLDNAMTESDIDWINTESDHIFSFRNCCEALGIDVQAARKALNGRLKIAKPHKKKLRWGVIAAAIEQFPGDYSHGYGECPPGITRSFCPECRHRYNTFYNSRHPRGKRRRRITRDTRCLNDAIPANIG